MKINTCTRCSNAEIENRVKVENDEGALIHQIALCKPCSEEHALFLLEKKFPKRGMFPWSR